MNGELSSKEEPALTQQAFDRLLASFDSDRERAAEKYENLRSKLVKFFEWRACAVAALDLADETINRVARRIDGGERIHNLSNYAYGVARMIYLERMKELKREEATRESLPTEVVEEPHETERLECFEACLKKLSDERRELIVAYYREQRRAKIELRKELAEHLGIPLNALRIRAHRIRTKLEECVVNCLQQSHGALK
jgi:DNA-directed RNA polymerase specialized sigma subunit, sigma24 homolog